MSPPFWFEVDWKVFGRNNIHHEDREDHEDRIIEDEFCLILVLQAFMRLTTEALRAQRKEFLIKRYSDLCELRVSAVK